MSFQDFQAGHHGGHLGYWNRTHLAIVNLHVIRNGMILTILNLHVAPMPPLGLGPI